MPNLYRIDGWVKLVSGQAVAGAQVYVCAPQPTDTSFIPPEPLASAWSDPQGVSPITFPIFTDGFGHYDAYLLPGVYTLVIVNNGAVQAVYADQSVGNIGSGGAPPSLVTSVFGRTGDILAQSGDYAAFYAPFNSPAFTGVPTAPTAPLATNTDQIATTAFVLANAGAGTVSSVFGRVGNVLAQSGDYGVADVTGAAPLASPSFSGTAQFVNIGITGTLADGTTSVGTTGQVLSSTGTSTLWVASGSGSKITIGTNASFKATPPASPNSGDTFVCSDSPFQYVYTGSVWQALVFGYAVTEPILANFTQVNVSSGNTVSDTHGGIILYQNSQSPFFGTGLVQSSALIGAGAYYVDMAFIGGMIPSNGGIGTAILDNTGGSIGSTSNKIVATKYGFEDTAGEIVVLHETANSFTGIVYKSSTTQPMMTNGPLTWLRMYDDGTTNITFYFSMDGFNWVQLYQEGRTTFLSSPAYAGFTASSYSNPGSFHIVHFSIHT